MSKIHYFQRYSSPENTVTNNTLQLFARIYDHSAEKLDQLLGSLLEETVGIGIEIVQQGRGVGSVPDGIILQRSFKLLVESKVDAAVDVDQLLKHCAGFEDEKKKILLLLTIESISAPMEQEIMKKIGVKYPSVIFCNVTYRELCNAMNGLFQQHDDDILRIISDYKDYCRDTQLISDAEYLMRIVGTGKSFDLNRRYAMYFDPADKGFTPHTFVGFNKNRSVRAIIKLKTVYEVHYVNGKLEKTLASGKATDEFDRNIIEIIREAKRECNYAVATGHKFFCGEEVFDTDFKKSTPYGMLGKRFVDLREYGIKDFSKTDKIAQVLRGCTWG